MANYSLVELTNKMQGKSVTLGWDALVFMNRAKVNSLLEQQYVTRFNSDSFLKRIFGAPAMTPDGDEVLELSGLILSHPRLSFEKASLRDSRATATMDIVSGTVSYVRKGSNQVPGVILYSYVVSAHQGFTLTMDIDLAASRGTVNEQGKVIIDIGDGYNCRCNLVNEDKAQEDLGNFFKALFLAQKPEDRVYELGMLDLRDVDWLAPRSFQIRTMATEEGKIRSSDDYGEGAVVLLVRTKGNPTEGDDPLEGALDYLIPNDRDAETGKALYSGSLVLASRAVFDWYIQDQIEKALGHHVRLKRVSESNYIARSLIAYSGGFELPGYYNKYIDTLNESQETATFGPQHLNFHDPDSSNALHVVVSSKGELQVVWSGSQKVNFRTFYWSLLFPDKTWHTSGLMIPNFDFRFAPIVDSSTNAVVFECRNYASQVAQDFSDIGGDDPFMQLPAFVKDEIQSTYRSAGVSIATAIKDSALVDSFDIPEINVLAISNLLFPERNALQLTEARLPGDLLMVGHIDPKETSFTLDPLLPVIKAGERQTFTIRQLGYRASDVTWSVRSVDGSRALGTIDNGEYTAPDAQLLDGSATRNVVTATYTDSATGKDVTASALVTVAMAGVVVTPSMSLIDMSGRHSVTLKATTLSGSSLTWTLRGNLGTLTPNGNEAVYTPPSTNPANTLETVLIDIQDDVTQETAIATVLLRSGSFALGITPAFHPGLLPSGRALLQGPAEATQITWEVVAGEGSITPEGLFTAPAVITAPYSVVKGTLAGVVSGYSIIHLSEHARQSNWYTLDTFEFEVTAMPPTVYANGLQQARVVVRVKPTDVDGQAVELSEAEYDSIRLVSADQKIPLPEVGEDGVPEGNKWYYTETQNTYDTYPHQNLAPQLKAQGDRPKGVQVKEFFVQCHKVEDLRVAAMLRSDNYEDFYSNPNDGDGEANRKVINLVAVQPPAAGSVGGIVLTFGDNGPTRVEGDPDDENDLSTLDYYYLKLLIRQVQVDIRNIEFIGNTSMVKWESDTSLEDVHSITGYALADDKNDQGKTILHIDPILMRRLNGQLQLPEETVNPGFPVPEGEVLFSLQRREYWRYDRYAKADFDAALNVIVYDAYGNKHTVRIGFDGVNRNKLKIVGQ
ncbi:hypothetical protein [Pseudomonas sp. T1.Ur]|uniref:hypothetical protein n=1 Tax=Pseudomonas sp. T1.Ur TaxID=2928704 RepID=UPI00201D4550|nr:hypothetical protein [Pseudomonas sp. T1.Ur]MCL6703289.1 hypothetical protein [Pseudomonas sp. T1.Ur]